MARFHVRSWQGVRDGDIIAVCAAHEASAQALRTLCVEMGVGDPAVYTDVRRLAQDRNVTAAWITAPNDTRVPIVEAVVGEVQARRSLIRAVAIEKPLARTVAEAKKILETIERAGLLHGYLENQVFAPSITRGNEIIWRRGKGIRATCARPTETRASGSCIWPALSWRM